MLLWKKHGQTKRGLWKTFAGIVMEYGCHNWLKYFLKERSLILSRSPEFKKKFSEFYLTLLKGSFYSESTDPFVISPNRWTKLLSWTWNFVIVKGSSHVTYLLLKDRKLFWRLISKWSLIWSFRAASGPYATWCEPFKRSEWQKVHENDLVCLFGDMKNAS